MLTPEIFPSIESVQPGSGGEIQLTDGLRHLLRNRPIYGLKFEGTRYDAGDKLGFLKATVEFALKRYDLGGPFREYLKKPVALKIDNSVHASQNVCRRHRRCGVGADHLAPNARPKAKLGIDLFSIRSSGYTPFEYLDYSAKQGANRRPLFRDPLHRQPGAR